VSSTKYLSKDKRFYSKLSRSENQAIVVISCLESFATFASGRFFALMVHVLFVPSYRCHFLFGKFCYVCGRFFALMDHVLFVWFTFRLFDYRVCFVFFVHTLHCLSIQSSISFVHFEALHSVAWLVRSSIAISLELPFM